MTDKQIIARYEQLRSLMQERVSQLVEQFEVTEETTLGDLFALPRRDAELMVWNEEMEALALQLPPGYIYERDCLQPFSPED